MSAIELLRIAGLEGANVQVWRIALDQGRAALSHFAAQLSPDEQRRAEGIAPAVERERFVVARGALRSILGSATGRAPDHLLFGRTPRGKPLLVQPAGETIAHFSLSRCESVTLIAVSRGPAFGVDIERISAGFPCDEVAARFIHPDEYEHWRSLPESGRRRAFFAWWTRTEAYAKARGVGLTQPLDGLGISIRTDKPAGPPHITGKSDGPPGWTLLDLPVGSRYAAALALARPAGHERRPEYRL
jgi:4'-phosphopantetheinyl transferase